MDTKYCSGCRKEHPVSEFSSNSARPDGLQTHCKLSRAAYNKGWYAQNRTTVKSRTSGRNQRIKAERRAWLREFLEIHPCVDCGEKDFRVLEFDHVRGEKKFTIGSHYGDVSFAELEEEVAKCEVRCANCHRRKTSARGGWWRGL